MEPIIVNYKPIKKNEIGCYKEKEGWYVWYWMNVEKIEGPLSEGEAKKRANEILEAGKALYAALSELGK